MGSNYFLKFLKQLNFSTVFPKTTPNLISFSRNLPFVMICSKQFLIENQNRDTNAAIILSFYQKKITKKSQKNHKKTFSKFTRIYFLSNFAGYKFGKGPINWNRGSSYKNMSHQSLRHFWQSVWNLALFGYFLVFL